MTNREMQDNESMSPSMHRSQAASRLVLFYFPFRRVAVGIGMAIGWLIPWLYEFTQAPAAREGHQGLVALGFATILATICVARYGRYRIDRPSGMTRWWSASVVGFRSGATCLNREAEGTALKPTWKRGYPVVRLKGQPAAVELPLPWGRAGQRQILDELESFFAEQSASSNEPSQLRPAPAQRSLLWIFSLMSSAAAVIALGRFASQEVISLAIAGYLLTTFVSTYWMSADRRSRVQAVLAAIYLPFIWLIAYNKPFGDASGVLLYLPVAPSVVPIMIASAGKPQWEIPAMLLLLMAEIWLSTAIARRSASGTLVILPILLGMSGFGSFVIHALYRM